MSAAKTNLLLQLADSIVTAAGDDDLSAIQRQIAVASLMSQYNAVIISNTALDHKVGPRSRKQP